MIKIGDRVKFINDTSVGYVSKISKDIIEVDVEDGFTVPCLFTDIVVVNEEDELAAMRSIGMGDERPGTKKAVIKKKQEEPKKSTREPAYARYGKIALIDIFAADEDTDDGSDDSCLDLDRIHDIYVRNKIASEHRERELEAARRKTEEEKQRIIEKSPVVVEEQVLEFKKMEVVAADELAAKLKVDLPKTISQTPPIKKPSDTEVIDLHASELLDSTNGMSSGEILIAQIARFTIALDLAIKSGKRGKLIFIHGVGSGKLKYEMQKCLSSKYPKLTTQDASFQEYGYGAILVIY